MAPSAQSLMVAREINAHLDRLHCTVGCVVGDECGGCIYLAARLDRELWAQHERTANFCADHHRAACDAPADAECVRIASAPRPT